MNRHIWNSLWIIIAGLLAAMPATAQAPLPAEAIRAEQAARWPDAASIYEAALEQEPTRLDLWLRLSDVYAAIPDRARAAEAIWRAVQLRPADAVLRAKLSQAYASAGEAAPALRQAEEAVRLDPKNVDFRRNLGQVQIWNGRYTDAAATYEKVLAAAPNDADARLGLARARSWAGDYNLAVGDYRTYLAAHDDDAAAWLELARTEGWRGNHPAALGVLNDYQRRFGLTDDYWRLRARLLALGGRPTEGLAIADRGLAEQPADYDFNAARALALANGRRPAEAVAQVQRLDQLPERDPETKGIRKFVLTPLRSYIRPSFTVGRDSDDVDILRLSVEGGYFPRPGTLLFGGYGAANLAAPAGSGLEDLNGAGDLWTSQGWIGIGHRFDSHLAVDGRVGGHRIHSGDTELIYRVRVQLDPSDMISVLFTRDDNYYDVSPRALSAGVTRQMNQVSVRLNPALGWYVDAIGGYDTFSDDNSRWEFIVAPRKSVLRRELMNLDLGFRGWWQGFDKNLDNGYYDPRRYQRYAGTAFTYWKLSENVGLSVDAAFGVLKDDLMDEFRFGGDVNAEASFGIFSSWMVVARAGYVSNNPAASGAYDGFIAAVSLTRRF